LGDRDPKKGRMSAGLFLPLLQRVKKKGKGVLLFSVSKRRSEGETCSSEKKKTTAILISLI